MATKLNTEKGGEGEGFIKSVVMGNDMALVDLLTDLSNFRYTDYGEGGSIQSKVDGRHGTPDDPIDNTDFDNGVGFGVDPNSTPQSFNVRGYTITGDKRFIVNFGGDIIGNEGSIYNGLQEFNNMGYRWWS